MKTLIAFPSFQWVASELITRNQTILRQGSVVFWRFPDTTPNLTFPHVKEEIEHQDIVYIWDFSEIITLFEQYNLLFNLVKNSIRSLTIIMPYFPVGTSERVERKGETESAHAFAHLLASLPSGLERKNTLHIFDIHALVEQSLFDTDRLHTELHTAMSLIDLHPWEKLVFPDDGAKKRFRYAFEDIPETHMILCSKVRKEGRKEIIIQEGEAKESDVLIVDDLIQSGGTLIETARVLRNHGARKVRAFAPHGVFPWDSYRKILSELDELIVTDSIPTNRERIWTVDRMQFISLIPLIEKILGNAL